MSPISPSPEFLALQRAVAGRYSLVRELGRGGMGIVYLARDVALERSVAIKLLPPQLAASAGYRERFLREARMAASLAHPNIVPIHLVEATGDVVFFVMAFVDGESLGERVRRRGPLPAREAMRVVQEVAWALGHAHARGIVHRDIKPDNILLDRDSGRAVVTDFGIARAAVEDSTGPAGAAGTPHYVSPEVARGEPGDARADLYALGVTAWYALTGVHPFDAASVPALLVKQASEPAPPIAMRAPELPVRFARVIDRCLAQRPGDRWPSADAMASEIDAARARDPVLPGPVRAFVSEVATAGDQVATGLVGAATAMGVLAILTRGGGLFETLVLGPMAILFLGQALLRVGSVGVAAFDLVERGYGFDSARAGLAQADLDRLGETADEPRRLRMTRVVLYGINGLVKEAVAIWVAMHDWGWVSVAGSVAAVLLPPFAVRTLWRMLHRGPGLWTRILRGRFGRAIFTVAEFLGRWRGKGTPAPASTVAALGSDAEATYLRLPEGLRLDLREVPRLLAALGNEAESLRRRADDPVHAERLATVVAAMEAMRLDLLSIEAGLVSVGDVTRHLEAASRVASRIDDALRARQADREPVTPETTPV